MAAQQHLKGQKLTVDFHLTEAQRDLRAAAVVYAGERLKPTAQERSDQSRWDPEVFSSMGEHGWPGVLVPREFGGLEAGAVEHALLVEEFSTVDASAGAMQNLLQQTVVAIINYAPDELRKKYLPRMASGKSFSITGLTESGAGSKLSDMSTTARQETDGWHITGVKTEVHVPQFADVALIFAKTDSGISAFLVPTDAPGFTVGEQRDIVGLRALPMYSIALEDCIVQDDHLLCGEGQGMRVFFKSFDLTRIGNAAKCVGIGLGALADAIAYARERNVGDGVVTDFQGIRWTIADLTTRLEAARLLTYQAACVYDESGRATREANMAKLLASTTAMDATTFAMQLTGSYGCFASQPFSRYLLDAKVSQLTGGSVEILRNIVSRELLGKESTGSVR